MFFNYFTVTAQYDCTDFIPSKVLKDTLAKKPIPDISFSSFIINCNVTDSIKKRILYLLDWKWTDEEIQNYLNNQIKEHYDWFEIGKNATKIANGNDSLFKKAEDSLILFWKEFILRKMNNPKPISIDEDDNWFNFYKVNDNIILAAGYLDLLDSKEILQKNKSDSDHYNRNIIETALARLGDAKAQKNVLNYYNYNHQVDGQDWMTQFTISTRFLFYIATQESTFKLHNWLDTSKKYNPYSGVNTFRHCSSILLPMLKEFILNKDFQKLMLQIPKGMPFYNDKIILDCKEWLIKNKGKYIINRKFAF
jgi:hypothetical protein